METSDGTARYDMSMQHRRSDFDVTNTVQVSSPDAVRHAIRQLFTAAWPQFPFHCIDTVFRDFEDLFTGKYPGFYGCDTVYHDLQHTLDATLAVGRLLVAHEKSCPPAERLGPERALIGVIVALFHDSGYLRRIGEPISNGAELTSSHVTRSSEMLASYLPTIGLQDWVSMATQIVHFSGYEVPFDEITVSDPRDRKIGHLLGTGDLIAQMSDRCYLEKCRDRLYPEFVLGGMTSSQDTSGQALVRYRSGLDVLRQTPQFAEQIMRTRLDGEFAGAYHCLEALFEGRNPYMETIQRNLEYLNEVLRTEGWPMLRREPPCFIYEDDISALRSAL
jgi:hypothetical protein